MHVLLLTPCPEALRSPILGSGDTFTAAMDEPHKLDLSADLILSFGYRHIFKEPILSTIRCPLLNLHISLLPWNRGADPNFWSWFDGTPKGVTLHHIDAGIDTGDIVQQRGVEFGAADTLASSYDRLHAAAIRMWEESWPFIRYGAVPRYTQAGAGSFRRSKDKEPWWPLPQGFATPVSTVEAMGRIHRKANAA